MELLPFREKEQEMRNIVRIIGVSLALMFGLLPFGAGEVAAQQNPARAAFDRLVTGPISADRAVEHIARLSETIGPRLDGLEGQWQATDYIVSELESYGYTVELQVHPVPDRIIGTVEFASGEQWGMVPATAGGITGKVPVSAELIRVFGGTSASHFPTETPGKIVLMSRHYSRYRAQVRNAADAGAVGVILFAPFGGMWGRPIIDPTDIPVLGGSSVHGEWLNEMLDQGPVTLSIQTVHVPNLESANVIAVKPPHSGDPDAKAVLIGAHYDTVADSPGANDNGSGVATALELARVFHSYNTELELRFVFFGSEERRLPGSIYYVDQLSGAELNRIAGVFVADMVANAHPDSSELLVMTVDGKSNVVSDAAIAAGIRLGDPNVFQGQFGRSDHESFHDVGVPAALFTRTFTSDAYHQPTDTLVNISPERLEDAMEITGAAVFDLIRKQVAALEKSRVRGSRLRRRKTQARIHLLCQSAQ
jgi:aminopeptidase YwaD